MIPPRPERLTRVTGPIKPCRPWVVRASALVVSMTSMASGSAQPTQGPLSGGRTEARLSWLVRTSCGLDWRCNEAWRPRWNGVIFLSAPDSLRADCRDVRRSPVARARGRLLPDIRALA